jgi:Family of unknown function (DUF6152)
MLARISLWVLLAVPAAACAHHSFAMFDMQKDLELRGVARSFTWQSPHSWLQVVVPDASASGTEWSIEMGAPGVLYKRGLRATSVKPGDKLTVVVHPLRDGRPGGSLVSVLLADGTKVEIGGGAGSPASPK